MKVILVFVSTLNGMITRGDDPEVRKWSSKSDQKYYSRVWSESRLVVMGSSTYDRNIIKPSRSRLILVMTSHPADYRDKEVKSVLEFTDRSPSELVSHYAASGYDLMTVVGGPKIAASFLSDSLIDELWLTIEPRLFSKGLNLIGGENLDIQLKLLECNKVNDNGTLITKYSIVTTNPLSSAFRQDLPGHHYDRR